MIYSFCRRALTADPIALLEALASGCAVASCLGSAEFQRCCVNSGAAILCRPANTSDFISAIRSRLGQEQVEDEKRSPRSSGEPNVI